MPALGDHILINPTRAEMRSLAPINAEMQTVGRNEAWLLCESFLCGVIIMYPK